jgi:peptide-methionine (S)-S-oxide reductase
MFRRAMLNRLIGRFLFGVLAIPSIAIMLATNVVNAAVTIPDPIFDAPLASEKGEQTAVVAGGCFWGVQAVYQHVKGVIRVKAGYSGGSADTAHYEMVCTNKTGHAEAVSIVFDPSRISYGQLLKVFFSVAHDPTQLNRQGPDRGRQYRSAIFSADQDQQRIAKAYIDQLNQAKVFSRPIATEVVSLSTFYQAEAYHQDYAVRHPDDGYIVINDLPKVANLRKQFPSLYTEK